MQTDRYCSHIFRPECLAVVAIRKRQLVDHYTTASRRRIMSDKWISPAMSFKSYETTGSQAVGEKPRVDPSSLVNSPSSFCAI